MGTGGGDNEVIRLNIGAGATELPGFTPIDLKVGRKAYPLDEYATNSVDEIYASHVLEHFSYTATATVLAEWVRVLKPGGRIRIAVPDFAWIASNYTAGKEFNVQGYTMGGHTDANDIHLAIFDKECLTEAMQGAGLERIGEWTAEIQDCSALPVSLNLQGYKPERREPKVPAGTSIGHDLVAVMSLPRLGFTDNFVSIVRACKDLRFDMSKSSGVFWGQCLERMFEEPGLSKKYILTVDYDTVFSPADVYALYRLMEEHPKVDALAPVQMQREKTTALFTCRDGEGKIMGQVPVADVRAPIMRVASAHFGLTILRADSLRKVPKPWFWSTPAGEPGAWTGWGDGREDDDTYFWRKWAEAGLTLYQANQIPVGHIEKVVTWPSNELTPIYQKASDWEKNGKPQEAIG